MLNVKLLAYILVAFVLCGCATYNAVGQCDADLGTSWAGNACVNAVQESSNRALVKALGDKACARARLGVSDAALAAASCEEARAKAEKAAWVEIEKGATNGQQPNLTLDHLVPREPPNSAIVTAASSGRPETSGSAGPPTQESSSSSSNTLVVNPPPAGAGSPGVVGSYSDVNSGQTSSPRQPPTISGMGTLAYLDARNGFRDLSFGSAPVAGMTLVEDHADEKYYQRPTDDLSVGSGQLTSITYAYYRNQLFSVDLRAKGLANSRALLDTLNAAYGEPEQQNEFMQRYFWSGGTDQALYDENAINGDSTTTILNKELFAAWQAGLKEKAAGSASQF